MDDNTFKKFLIINQIIIEKALITCTKCNNWLTRPVYEKNVSYYCGQCIPEEGTRITALEAILNNYKYPCVNEYCKDLLEYAQIIEHANNCNNVVMCTFCNANCDTMIWEHLRDEHKAEVIVTDKAKFTLTLSMPMTSMNMYLIKMYEAQFVFFCTQKGEVLRGTLMKLRGDDIGNYGIHMTTNRGNTSTHDGTVLLFGGKHYPENETAMYFGTGDSCKLVVSLGPRQYSDVAECAVYCARRIPHCLLCREKISGKIINVQHLYPDAIWPCKNNKRGCLAYLIGTQIESHETRCAFRYVDCCYHGYKCMWGTSKCNVITHMKSDHELNDNFDVVETGLSAANKFANFTAYFEFDSEVFKCFNLSDNNNLELKCEMLYMHAKCNHQYRFELHILHNKNATKAVYILSNAICNNNNCKVLWRKLGDIASPLFVRCCIFKDNSLGPIACVKDISELV